PGRPVRRQLRESRRKQFVPPAAKQVDLERVVSDEDPGLGRSLSEANGVELRRVALRIDDRQQRARTGLSCAGALRRVGIAVGHNDERNFEVSHKPHVWSEVRAAYRAWRASTGTRNSSASPSTSTTPRANKSSPRVTSR